VVESSDDHSVQATPQLPATNPRDLYPTSDIRFVLVEIGKLTTKVDRLIDDTGSHGDKIDAVRHQITFVKGAMWVIGIVVIVLVAVATWYFTGKLSITIAP
jgi:hypothetical protein